MPPSQLKRLKASLRDQGVTGPQRSKKQKKTASKEKTTNDRIQRSAALQQIRDAFNPFELRQPSRPAKFESVSHKSANAQGKTYKDVLYRPGVSKSAGEEMRRMQLLPEMQRRNKVGGLVDRRIGEGDPGMTAEERAIQRFAREKRSKTSLFDLEGSDDDEPKVGLTHLGRSLTELDGSDIDAGSLADSDNEDTLVRKKRPRDEQIDDAVATLADEPDRKKTKKEVMEEVIAKSKMHKYERQKTKEDDDDIRAELDQGMGEMLALLRDHKRPAPKPVQISTLASGLGPSINPDRQRLLDGMDRGKADKEYEKRLRELAQDSRAHPSDRVKTAEEKASESLQRSREQEEKRAKRMRGDPVSDDEDPSSNVAHQEDEDSYDKPLDDKLHNQAAEFGLHGADETIQNKTLHEDEDEFEFNDDFITGGSGSELSDDTDSEEDSNEKDDEADDSRHAEDAEFVQDLLGETTSGANSMTIGVRNAPSTYPCPTTHSDLLEITKDLPVEQLPSVIKRIRALHHPSLEASNKEAMAKFSTCLVDHIAYMAAERQPVAVAEQVIRHLHSLSRTFPEEIAESFRAHLHASNERAEPSSGDLLILAAIGRIYPTSDHFHQVVTPATTIMARWLGMSASTNANVMESGAILVALCVDYQKLSRRYIPEALRFTLNALRASSLNADSLEPHLENLIQMAELWKDKPSFPEIFAPAVPILERLGEKQRSHIVKILLQQARQRRRPLELHHHRPQPIRTSIPKFEEGFNPDNHYDPDKERSDARKLQKEFKREKKGAMRELRKDANFIAREQLREKKIRDEEYEKKQRRLIAEIQGEEGHEAKEYEREKRRRKSQK